MDFDSSRGSIVYFKKNNCEYASFKGKSIRSKDMKGPKKEFDLYLGRPIDKEHLVFYSKNDGIFIFNKYKCEKNKPKTLNPEVCIRNYNEAVTVWNSIKNKLSEIKRNNEDLSYNDILDIIVNCSQKGKIDDFSFSISFFLINLIKEIDYDDVISAIPNVSHDIIKALLIFKLGFGDSYSNAIYWYNSDISSILLSKANLSSQNISKILKMLGSPGISINFLKKHIEYIKNIFQSKKINFHIDSTALDNEISIYYSRTYYHGTTRHHGFRLVVAVHIPSGLPIYYEIVHGNIIDQTTIERVVTVLSLLDCKVFHISGDAGYCNIKRLERLIFLDSITSFTTRFNNNYKAISDKIEKELLNFDIDTYKFKYKNRIIQSKKTYIVIKDKNCDSNKRIIYIYIYKDEKSKRLKVDKLEKSKEYEKMSVEEIDNETNKYGVFALLSTRDLTNIQALTEYFSRLCIEQYFDMIKNDLNVLPIREHNVETVQGHILLTFIASFFIILIKNRLKLLDDQYINISPKYNNTIFECDPADIENDIIRQDRFPELVPMSLKSIFNEMRGQRALVFHEYTDNSSAKIGINTIIPTCPTAQCKNIYSAFGLAYPFKIVQKGIKIDIIYGYNYPTGKTKYLSFSAPLCKDDVKKISEKNGDSNKDKKKNPPDAITYQTKKKNVKNNQNEFESINIIDHFFDPWLTDTLACASADNLCRSTTRKVGRPKGSKNLSTLEKNAAKDAEALSIFDHFFDPWLSNMLDDATADNLCRSLRRKAGRPKGSKNLSTLERNAAKDAQALSIFDHFFDPWLSNMLDGATADNLCRSLRRKAGRPKGSKNLSNLENKPEAANKVFSILDHFFDPWLSNTLDSASTVNLCRSLTRKF